MKPLSLILITAFLSLNLCARDIIKDPEFKKKDKYWHLHKNNEYKNVEPKFKRGSVSFEISHTSEHYYVCFLTEAPVKEGKTYQVSFKFMVKAKAKFTSLNEIILMSLREKDLMLEKISSST